MAGMNNNNDLTVKVRLNLEDYIQANRVFFKKRLYLMGIFYSVFALLISLYSATKKGPEIGILTILQGVIIAAVFGALASFLEWTTIKAKSKRVFNSNKQLGKQQIYGLSSTGIEVKTESGSGVIPWANIYKFVESNTGFYLYTGKQRALVVPKKVLKKPEEIVLFRRLVQENVGRIKSAKANETEEGD